MLFVPSVLSGVLWATSNSVNILFSGFAIKAEKKEDNKPLLENYIKITNQEMEEVRLEDQSIKYDFGSINLSFKKKLALFLGASTAFFGSTLAISLYMDEGQKTEGVIIGSEIAATALLSALSLAINFKELSNYFCRG